MSVIVTSIIVLGVIGIVGAAVLYLVAKRFYVYEDPRIDQVEAVLPGANCGGCGRSGCRDFATACVGASSLDGLACPVGGSAVMSQVGSILGMEAVETKPKIAVLKCNGTCDLRPSIARYEGAVSCAVLATLGSGSSPCPYGCLGCGDCAEACGYDALHINPETGLPEVNEDKCVACGACVKACPRNLFELRYKGPRGMRVYVACSNKEKGAVAMKECKVACIGCGKCFKACPFEAITIADNLSYIDFEKCRLCRKCVPVCPTHAILDPNFPTKAPAPAPAKPAAAKPATAPAEKPAAAPAEKPAEAPAEKPAAAPAEKPAAAPAEKPAEAPFEKLAEAPVEKPKADDSNS